MKLYTTTIKRAGLIRISMFPNITFLILEYLMSDREPTRWQHNRIYPHPINPCVYTYDSHLYCCENVDAHCFNIIKP